MWIAGRWLVSLWLVLVLFGTTCARLPQSTPGRDATAASDLPPHRKLQLAPDGNAIEDQYIVIFQPTLPDVSAKVNNLLMRFAGMLPEDDNPVLITFSTVFKGMVVRNWDAKVLISLLADDDVILVTQDTQAQGGAMQLDPESWGLDRIDQVSPSLTNTYRYDATGVGVDIYILDNGIRSSHDEFNNGRRRVNCLLNLWESWEDCEGGSFHGTRVAGVAGGANFGVAKDANLMSVKVLNSRNFGPMSFVIGGLDYVTRQKKANPARPMIANLSLFGGYSEAANRAVKAAVEAGVIVVTIAGNHNDDACTRSPGSASDAITVAATSRRDARAGFSGYGLCVDIFAPGAGLKTADHVSDAATILFSGTSTSAAFVSGVAALYLERHPTATPTEVWEALRDAAVRDAVGDTKGSPNLLLNTISLLGIENDAPTPAPSMTQSAFSPSETEDSTIEPSISQTLQPTITSSASPTLVETPSTSQPSPPNGNGNPTPTATSTMFPTRREMAFDEPTLRPIDEETTPTTAPSVFPTLVEQPTAGQSDQPTLLDEEVTPVPTETPFTTRSDGPTFPADEDIPTPVAAPSVFPTLVEQPTAGQSDRPTLPEEDETPVPTETPSTTRSDGPITTPVAAPSVFPTTVEEPTAGQSDRPTLPEEDETPVPTETPSTTRSDGPITTPVAAPSVFPTTVEEPTAGQSDRPTLPEEDETPVPTETPSTTRSDGPITAPVAVPSVFPTLVEQPTAGQSDQPTLLDEEVTPVPTETPFTTRSDGPTFPADEDIPMPVAVPSAFPTIVEKPTAGQSDQPTLPLDEDIPTSTSRPSSSPGLMEAPTIGSGDPFLPVF